MRKRSIPNDSAKTKPTRPIWPALGATASRASEETESILVVAIARSAQRSVVPLLAVAPHARAHIVQDATLIVEALVDLRLFAKLLRCIQRIPRLRFQRKTAILAFRAHRGTIAADGLPRVFGERAIRASVAIVGAFIGRETANGTSLRRSGFSCALAPFRTLRHR